jgi:hypothetical protein
VVVVNPTQSCAVLLETTNEVRVARPAVVRFFRSTRDSGSDDRGLANNPTQATTQDA